MNLVPDVARFGIRLETSSKTFATHLLNLPLLKDKISGFNHSTGEILGKVKAKYQDLTFEVYPSGRVIVSGSLHKYFNSGKHNHNDFDYFDLLLVLQDLESNFGNEILNITVTGLEFGLNINTPFDPQRFTDRCIAHGNKARTPIVKNDVKGFDKGICFHSTDYRIKIYNKSKQYGQPINILRLEAKYLRSRIFDKAQIKLLRDIANPASIDILKMDLFACMDELIYKEDLNTQAFSRNEERIYLESINPFSWREWSKEKRYKRSIQFHSMIQKATSNDKNLVLGLMAEKAQKLFTISTT